VDHPASSERPDEAPGDAAGASSAAVLAGSGTRVDARISAVGLRLAGTVAILAAAAFLAGTATWSNLNATATNPANSISTGTIQLSSGSFTTPVVSLSAAKPGAVSTGCIQITNSGTLSAQMRLYGTGSGTGLNEYLKLVITRGSFSATPPAGSCAGFTADATNYIAQGAGVIYSGTLASLPSSASTALLDPTASSPATWSSQSTHGYQMQVTLLANASAQGLTGKVTFTFEEDSV
jgi:hypothetical protein